MPYLAAQDYRSDLMSYYGVSSTSTRARCHAARSPRQPRRVVRPDQVRIEPNDTPVARRMTGRCGTGDWSSGPILLTDPRRLVADNHHGPLFRADRQSIDGRFAPLDRRSGWPIDTPAPPAAGASVDLFYYETAARQAWRTKWGGDREHRGRHCRRSRRRR